jgi:hypothetical protein
MTIDRFDDRTPMRALDVRELASIEGGGINDAGCFEIRNIPRGSMPPPIPPFKSAFQPVEPGWVKQA